MLMKLTPGDDIPLRLGARLPRPEEKARNIAEMERIAKVLDDLDGEVRWVVNAEAAGGEGRIDPTIQTSDYEGAIEAGVIEDYREGLRAPQAAPRHVWEYYAPGEKVGPYTKQRGSNSYILTEPPTAHEPAMEWYLTEPTDDEVREYFKVSATRPRSLLDHDHALMTRRLALRAFLREQRAGVSAPPWDNSVAAAFTALEVMREQQCKAPHGLRDALDAVNEQQRLDAMAMREHEAAVWGATRLEQKRLAREAIAQWTPPTSLCIGIDRAAPPADFTAFCRKP